MKRAIILLFFTASIMNNLYSQEMQISFGPEAAFGVYSVDNEFALTNGYKVLDSYYVLDVDLYNQNTDSLFFAPGINFSIRLFANNDKISRGFFFRDRAIFLTNITEKGTFSKNLQSQKVNETYSLKNMDFLMYMMDFDTGWSDRFIISERIQLYSDFGLNFTIIDYERNDSKETYNYYGGGIYAGFAMQLNLTKKVYLEFGINSIINVFSSLKGKVNLSEFGGPKEYKYEDAGRWDLMYISTYINIGWRIDLKQPKPNVLNLGSSSDSGSGNSNGKISDSGNSSSSDSGKNSNNDNGTEETLE